MSSIFRIEHNKDARLRGYPSYRVVHVASGVRIVSRYADDRHAAQAEAEAAVAWLESLPVDWDFTDPNGKKADVAIAAVQEAFHQGDKS